MSIASKIVAFFRTETAYFRTSLVYMEMTSKRRVGDVTLVRRLGFSNVVPELPTVL